MCATSAPFSSAVLTILCVFLITGSMLKYDVDNTSNWPCYRGHCEFLRRFGNKDTSASTSTKVDTDARAPKDVDDELYCICRQPWREPDHLMM